LRSLWRRYFAGSRANAQSAGSADAEITYLHGNIAKQVSPTNNGVAGAKFDAFAMRTQVAF
jgi:hypothetical protein